MTALSHQFNLGFPRTSVFKCSRQMSIKILIWFLYSSVQDGIGYRSPGSLPRWYKIGWFLWSICSVVVTFVIKMSGQWSMPYKKNYIYYNNRTCRNSGVIIVIRFTNFFVKSISRKISWNWFHEKIIFTFSSSWVGVVQVHKCILYRPCLTAMRRLPR